MKTTTKTGVRARTETGSNVYVQDKVARASILTMGGISGLIGVWSLLCFASALLGNGPIEMMKGVFSALTGI